MPYLNSRLSAAKMAHDLVNSEFIVLDTETTGLDKNDEIIEISIISHDGTVLLDTLIKPLKKIPQAAINIHGITNEDVKNAPRWRDIHNIFSELVLGKTVVIYNRNFDTRLIKQTCKKYALQAPSFQSKCAMLLYARYNGTINKYTGDYRWHKLTDATSHFGMTIQSSHRALEDARLTLYLMLCMAEAYPQKSITDNAIPSNMTPPIAEESSNISARKNKKNKMTLPQILAVIIVFLFFIFFLFQIRIK